MKRRTLPRLPRLLHLPRLAAGMCAAGMPLLGVGCAQDAGALAAGPPVPSVAVVRAAGQEAETPAPAKVVPVSLDAVLRLACDNNRQIELAREKLREACAEKDVAGMGWFPNVYLGTSYWRHEGGIQNEDGTLTHSSTGALFAGGELKAQFDLKEVTFQRLNAERKVWQQRGELSRITSETLLEATTSYIDLLHARTAEAIALQLGPHQDELLNRARKLAGEEKPARLQLEGIETDAQGHRLAVAKLHAQGDAAAAKLAYLLGIDPCVPLAPVDERLLPVALVDANIPACDLVAQATTSGPGVRELEGLLAVVLNGIEKSKGPGMWMPTLEMRMAEGGFGAGPGDSLTWDNRWDLNLQARWNLTEFLTGRERQRVAQSKVNQIVLSQQDLRGKLAAGVLEARDAVLSGQEQLRFAAAQIQHAGEAYRLAHARMLLGKNIENPTTEAQVLQALRTLEMAHVRYLEAVSAFDKAQLRLLVLLGAANCSTPPPPSQPAAVPDAPAVPQAPKAAPGGEQPAAGTHR